MTNRPFPLSFGVTCKCVSRPPLRVLTSPQPLCRGGPPPQDLSRLVATCYASRISSPSEHSPTSFCLCVKPGFLKSINARLRCFFLSQFPSQPLQIWICKTQFSLLSVLSANSVFTLIWIFYYMYNIESLDVKQTNKNHHKQKSRGKWSPRGKYSQFRL